MEPRQIPAFPIADQEETPESVDIILPTPEVAPVEGKNIYFTLLQHKENRKFECLFFQKGKNREFYKNYLKYDFKQKI